MSNDVNVNGFLIRFVFQNLKMILISSFSSLFQAIGISFVLPRYFETSASFLALSQVSYDSYQLLDPKTQSLIGYGKKEDISNIIAILNSKSFKSEIVQKADLINYYGYKDNSKPLDAAIKNFDSNYKISLNKDEGLISIKVLDIDNKVSYKIINLILEGIEKRLLFRVQLRNKRILSLLERNIQKKSFHIDSLNERIRLLRTKFNIINTETQSEYIVQNILYKSNSVVSEDVKLYIQGIDEVKYLEKILEEESILLAESQSRFINLQNSIFQPLETISISELPYLSETASKPNVIVFILGFTILSVFLCIFLLLVKKMYFSDRFNN